MMRAWLAQSVRPCGLGGRELRGLLDASLRRAGFHTRSLPGSRSELLKYWRHPGPFSWGEFVDVRIASTGPAASSVLVTASPIIPINLSALSACERDVASVMHVIETLGVAVGPERVLTWNERVLS
jgi:hypothetical protein